MTTRPASHAVPEPTKTLVSTTLRGSGTANAVPADKSAGQRLCPASPSLKGVSGCSTNPHPHPLEGGADLETHPHIAAIDDPDDAPDHEPTDEELWLEQIARQVEADARPLFAAIWIWLLRRALQADEEEPA